jgi:hypothetical protein
VPTAQGTYNAHVRLTPDQWATFKARCVRANVQLRDRLAQLIEADIAGHGPPLVTSGKAVGEQLPPAASSRRRAKQLKRTGAARGRQKAATGRKRLPVVSEQLIKKEAAAGARTARKRRASRTGR